MDYMLVCEENKSFLLLGKKWEDRESRRAGFSGWRDEGLGRFLTREEMGRAIEMFTWKCTDRTLLVENAESFCERYEDVFETWNVFDSWEKLNQWAAPDGGWHPAE